MSSNAAASEVVSRERTYASRCEREARAYVRQEGAFGGQVVARNGASVLQGQ